jgi:hypothetical protein
MGLAERGVECTVVGGAGNNPRRTTGRVEAVRSALFGRGREDGAVRTGGMNNQRHAIGRAPTLVLG